MNKSINILSILLLTSNISYAIGGESIALDSDTIQEVKALDEVVVRSHKGVRKLKGVATNSEMISTSELKRAACCNLGESFTNNPSVEVTYTDAATGARQIKLLGLSGSYVQMLTETVPNFRGAAAPYGLSYIAGPWIHSIQVSKGANSVKNGFESITGQINVEMKKPQNDPSVSANAYVDQNGKVEANFDGNLHFGERWSGGLLVHGENTFESHDSDGDGFIDMPKVRQGAIQNRWAYMGDKYVFQVSAKFIGEKRESGQDAKHSTSHHEGQPLYTIDINTQRAEVFAKNAYIFDKDNDANVALILSGNYHNMDASYGNKLYDIIQTEGYASLMFERKWNEVHALSTGLSMIYDKFNRHYRLTNDTELTPTRLKEHEATPGAYAQYTFNNDSHFIAMAGLRYDHSSVYGSMVTPRLHLRWNIADEASLQASAGRGYRSPHVLEEYNYLLASSRRLVIASDLKQEKVWNMGACFSGSHKFGSRQLTYSAEYFYTTFDDQTIVDMDSDPHAAIIGNLNGKSFSHTLQFEAGIDIIRDLNFSAAYRMTDVKVDYGQGLVQKYLTSRSKVLLSASYTPMMSIWQFDLTYALTGGGRMPTPYTMADGSKSWSERYSAFSTLNAQITRNFRKWAVYIGGENLTGFKQENAIIDAANPWGSNFDATLVYGPLHGATIYAGFRYTFTKYL
jgi:outer membrane receptor for ferrienterochelin and colicin